MLFIGTFFICLFIFMMQFLWRYVDELVGKGLDMKVMAQFFFYSALSLVPVSLPLAVLLASLITFGNFGERFELLAMKAAGISLMNVMRPLIFFVVGLVFVSFYFQNIVGPMAQAKLGTLIISMKQKSPELDIPEGVFYSEIPDNQLRVQKKNRKTGMLYDVLIYNFKDGFDNAHVIYADSGRMEMTKDKHYLWLHLYNGDLFENLRAQNLSSQNVPYRRESFLQKHIIIEFDSDFNLADASIMSNQSSAKDMKELQNSIDSIKIVGDSIGRNYYNGYAQRLYGDQHVREIDLKGKKVKIVSLDKANKINVDSIFSTFTLTEKQRVVANARRDVEDIESDLDFKSYTMDRNDYVLRKHETEWHNKITISLSCLLFFFIGAPLGGIIRKGGLGMPVVVSVLVFIIYYIINNTGYKMSRDGKWIVWVGMWMSTMVLVPLGAFLTYKANNDSVVLNTDAYIAWFKKIVGIRSKRHMSLKEVVIEDPDYIHLPDKLDGLSTDCQGYIHRNKLKKAPNYSRFWLSENKDNEMADINEQLESLIEEMSNTRSPIILDALQAYPLVSTSAHLLPFKINWLNWICGIVVPIGLFFYFRIWIFRIRLNRDLEKIIANNKKVIMLMQTNKIKK